MNGTGGIPTPSRSIGDRTKMKTVGSDKKKKLLIAALAAAGLLFSALAAAVGLFIRALLPGAGEEEAHPIASAEETPADAGAESLAVWLQTPAEQKILSWKTVGHREKELVFSFSMADFIDSFNGFYWQDHAVRLLPPRENWGSVTDRISIHSDHETEYCVFSRDARAASLPTLSVYVPADADLVQEITVDFDDHGYSDRYFREYEEMCYDTLRVFFPGLSEETLRGLIRTLNDYAYEHVLPNEQGYYHGAVPQVMYCRDGVGVYPYFAVGEFVHFCVIPVTDASAEAFRAQGTRLETLG